MPSLLHMPALLLRNLKSVPALSTYRHKALVVFSQDGGYQVTKACTDQESYPTASAVDMAMLIAQHSASIPDPYCITYTPTSKWDSEIFHTLLTGRDGLAALQGILGGGGGKKRKCPSQCNTPRSTCSLASSWSSASTAAHLHPQSAIMQHLHRLTSKALCKEADRKPLMEIRPVHDFKSRPDHARAVHQQQAGAATAAAAAYSVKGLPCIVQALVRGKVKVHKKNASYLWVPPPQQAADEAVVDPDRCYIKCLDPECTKAAQRHWDITGDAGSPCQLDSRGWGSLAKMCAHFGI